MKQQLVQLEQSEKQLSKKAGSRRLMRVIGIIGLVIGFLVLAINKGESMALIRIGLLLFIVGLIVLAVGLFGLTFNNKLKQVIQQIVDLKNEIIKEEHSK